MPDIITLERKFDYSPNIVALVNWGDFFTQRLGEIEEKMPIRGYIFDINLNEIYGGIMQASQHFIRRTIKPEKRREELFLLGFVKGKILHDEKTGEDRRLDRDIVYCPYEKSDGKLKTKPYLVKDAGVRLQSELGKGILCSYPVNMNQDMITISAAEIKTWEEAHRQTEMNPIEYFCTTLPNVEGIEYKDIHTINV